MSNKLRVSQSGSGNPTTTTPNFKGEIYIDEDNGSLWRAYGTSVGNFYELNNSGNGIVYNIVTLTGNTTLDSNYYWILSNSETGDHELTLPSSPTVGQQYLIKKVSSDSYKTTVIGNGNLIDGETENYIYYKYDAKGYVYSTDFGWNVF